MLNTKNSLRQPAVPKTPEVFGPTTFPSILDQIVARNRQRLERVRRAQPQERLQERIRSLPPPMDFAGALRGKGVRLIAEVKKASPSAGVLRPRLRPVALARAYARAGVAAISVLTEPEFFKGSLGHLAAIRAALDREGPPAPHSGSRPPLLRKDFLFDDYQIYQARAYGADAVLLISAILEQEELPRLLALARELGMEALVEVHDEEETRRAVACDARVIGINNRDLRTFQADLALTRRLRPLIPGDRIVVSESGIRTRADLEQLQRWGAQAVLVGEALVTATSIKAKLQEFLG